MFTKEAIEQLAEAQAIGAANDSLQAAKDGRLGAIALPQNYLIHDLEKGLPNRMRARGTMATSSLAAFAAYVREHADAGASVFIDADNMRATAVLNLGSPAEPGHADNIAIYAPKKTAEFAALLAFTAKPQTQKDAAEWLEDWSTAAWAFEAANGEEMTMPQAVAAIRSITIESVKKLQAEEGQLSASRSAFESIEAKSSAARIPAFVRINLQPHVDMERRIFKARVNVLTGQDKPQISLRIAAMEDHAQAMAAELVELVQRDVIGLPVMVGQYAAGK